MGNKRCSSLPLTQAFKRQRSFCAARDGRLSPHHKNGSAFRKKHVKFASNLDGSVKSWECYIDILRKDLDKPNMFYSREEKEAILEECEEAIDFFKQHNLEATSNFEAVFKYCRQPPSHEASSLLETMQLQVPVDARGMEWGWAGSVTAGYKKTHVKKLTQSSRSS